MAIFTPPFRSRAPGGTRLPCARIEAQLDRSFAQLEANGTSPAEADAFEAFLARPETLQRESLIVRCRFDGESFDVRTIVDKAYSRRRVRDGLLPCLDRIKPRLAGRFDVFVLISDMVYVSAPARTEFVEFLGRVPFLRCDWLEGDPVSSNALVIPDLWLLESAYGDEVTEIDRAAALLPFERRKEIIKWRGGLSGPGYPDLDNCLDFPRYRLLLQALRHPDVIDARLTHYDNLAAGPSGDALRERLQSWFGPVAPTVPPADFTAYKYLISTDGVAASWKRVATILWTGSVLLMQHRWRQFFYPGLVAWEHYVPLADDLSDVMDRYDWLRANPGEAASIAQAGQEFARRVLTPAAIDDYMRAVLTRSAGLL
jgi:hypothetical protein